MSPCPCHPPSFPAYQEPRQVYGRGTGNMACCPRLARPLTACFMAVILAASMSGASLCAAVVVQLRSFPP